MKTLAKLVAIAALATCHAQEVKGRRPQVPVRPYPYREEDVVYENPAAAIKLAATLTIPSGQGPFSAVILITGSGPQDRDESMAGHRPFLILSDYLTRRGIAVLRADDRGIGKSTGNFQTATTADFAADAEAGVAYLKTRSEVDPRRIGLIGHSEGGIIAPMLAARNPDVAFIVMMAAPGVPGDEIVELQPLSMEEANGVRFKAAEKEAAQQREVDAIIKTGHDEAAIERKLRQRAAEGDLYPLIEGRISVMNSTWFRYSLNYDPAVVLRKVTRPVLAINGEKDIQVSPKQNLPVIRRALEESGNKDFEVDELPGLNHLFQTAATGAPREYAEIEETMSPLALEKIANWISNLPGIRP
jgi:pimeloyl-ACP methyl ester carboxylesterase